jgi:hypothetical protein
VEVYLRLQELGKASGILLLPPGAMDRLVAARKASEPTVAYTPAETKVGSRRWLFLAGAVLALAALVILGFILFGGGKRDRPREESLLGVKVGDGRDAVVEKLHLGKPDFGDPWAGGAKDPLLVGLLGPGDLGKVQKEDLPDLELRKTPDGKVGVLFHDGKVVAVVARKKGSTAMGMSVGKDLNTLYDLYPEGGKAEELGPGVRGEGRRYDKLGLRFHIQGHHVVGIALYLAKS